MAELRAAPPFDATPFLGPEREALLELLDGLSPAQWEASTECPAWSVKGIALHVLGDDLSLLARQRDEATNGLFLYAADHPGLDFRQLLDGFNEQWVTAAQFLSTELVVGLLELTGELTEAFYTAVDPEAPGEAVGFFGGVGSSPYWQAVAREYVERWVHQQQIRRAVGAPDLGPDLLSPAGHVALRGVAAHLRDLGAPPGATIGITIPGVESWTLQRTDPGWTVLTPRDAGSAPLVTVEVAPDRAVAALSRGLDGEVLGDTLAVSGDPGLTGPVVKALVALLSVTSRPASQPAPLQLRPIGKVESPLTDPGAAPKQGHEGAPDCWLVFEAAVLPGLAEVQVGDQLLVLTWLDRAQRDVLQVHPRDDPSNPLQGVFTTRSADRPNPVGLHQVEVLAVDGPRLHVRNLEALNGTPIVDVKPVLGLPGLAH